MEFFVPGRICLFGEHTDWASSLSPFHPGCAICICTTQGIHANVTTTTTNSNSNSSTINFTSFLFENDSLTFDLLDISKSTSYLQSLTNPIQNFSYIAGTILVLLQKYPSKITTNNLYNSIHINIYKQTLPLKKGLSSSAAVCVLTTKIFNSLFSLNLSIEEIMDIAYCGERKTPSMCGKLDQVVAFGEKSIVLMDFFSNNNNNSSISFTPISNQINLFILLVDLNSTKNTIEILKSLQTEHQQNKSLQDLFGKDNKQRIQQCIQLLTTSKSSTNNLTKIGNIMTQYQQQFDLVAAPCTPELHNAINLHLLLKDETIQKQSLGGKMVGSGGDGSAQFLCKDENQLEKLQNYIHLQYPSMKTFKIVL